MMIYAIVLLFFLTLLSLITFRQLAHFTRFFNKSATNEQAVFVADAGLDYAIWKIHNGDPSPHGDSYNVGEGEFEITVDESIPTKKFITSKAYVPNKTAVNKSTRTAQITLEQEIEEIKFDFGVQSEEDISFDAGIIADFSIVNGNVFSNRDIIDAGGCDYPPVEDCKITGNAEAGTSIDSTIYADSYSFPISPPYPSLPTLIELVWEEAANINDDPEPCSTTCELNGPDGFHIGPKKYLGNVKLFDGAWGNINGPIYITGDFTMADSSRLSFEPDNSCSVGTVLFVNGDITIAENVKIQPNPPVSPDSYLLLYSKNGDVTIEGGGDTNLKAFILAPNGTIAVSTTPNRSSDTYGGVAGKNIDLNKGATITHITTEAATRFQTDCSETAGELWKIKRGSYQLTR